jgi:hypothetical protein
MQRSIAARDAATRKRNADNATSLYHSVGFFVPSGRFGFDNAMRPSYA